MHVITLRRLREFWETHEDAEQALRGWHQVAEKADWSHIVEVRQAYPHADAVGRFTVFNISGNKYRLITFIHYNRRRIYVREVLTHDEYDRDRWKE